jgi:anti-anti-sigma regulatory factor
MASARLREPRSAVHEVTAGFTVESGAACATTQLVVAGGAVGLPEARWLEAGVIEGLGKRRTSVVLDLTAVTAVGPGLLGVLLRIRRGVTGVGGRLVLVVAGPPVSELVATSLLGRLIDVAPDRGQAMELIAPQTSPALGPPTSSTPQGPAPPV